MYAPSFLLLLLELITPLSGTQSKPTQTATPPATIAWSATRPLTWADFQSKPQPLDRLAALTSGTIESQVGCRDFQFTATVRAVFTPSESWVRDPAKATPGLLRHEQLHFDITELYARKLRQKLSVLKLDCEHLQPTLNTLTKAVFAEWQREEARYDQETNHSLNQARQEFWEAQVAQKLKALDAFAAPI